MLEKTTVNLRQGDFDYLKKRAASRGLTTSVILRYIVSRFVDEDRQSEEIGKQLMDEIVL